MTARTHFRPLTGILLALATTGLMVALPVPATAQTPAGPCPAGTGVTVVVDFSDLGGTVQTGCAAGDPATGRDALASAGFASQDSIPGMVCAIDSSPDPCPTTFDGSFWSYWHAHPGDAWTSHLTGADTSAPVRGEVEGWRYNDGAVGPGSGTAELTALADAAPLVSPAVEEPASPDSGPLITAIAIGSVLLLLGAAVLLAVRRRTAQGRP